MRVEPTGIAFIASLAVRRLKDDASIIDAGYTPAASSNSLSEKNHIAGQDCERRRWNKIHFMRRFESVTKSVDLAVRWWPRAGAWAFVALLFSSVFTVFNLMMAVLMPLADFGLFSYGQSLVLLVGVLIATLVLEPTTTVGTKYEDHEQLRYLSFSLIGSLVVGLVTAAPLAAIFWIVQSNNSLELLFAAVIVSPLAQSFHVVRRYLYMREQFRFLIALGVLHAILLLAALVILWLTGTTTPANALAATGVAGAIPTVWLVSRLRLWRHLPPSYDVMRYARDHWSYARWTLAAAAPHWLSTSGIVPVAIWFFSLEAGSIYRICQLVVSPILQLSQVSSQILLPFVSQRAHVRHASYLADVERKAFWLYLAIAIASTAIVLAILPYLMNHLIPQELRTVGVVVLILLLVGTFFDVLRGAQTVTVSAAGRTEFLFISAAASALIMYLVTVPLVFLIGVPAIAVGFMIGRISRYAIIRFTAARWVAPRSQPRSRAETQKSQ
ncbi:MAG: lipopolysaccharide biosynthesis protein [Xanthobacteraceae bacterium]